MGKTTQLPELSETLRLPLSGRSLSPRPLHLIVSDWLGWRTFVLPLAGVHRNGPQRTYLCPAPSVALERAAVAVGSAGEVRNGRVGVALW